MLLPGESIESFSEKIKVITSKEHTFGTDTMLLADFSMPKKFEVAVEIGTGCGAIPMYWLSMTEVKKVFAIDIQKKACQQLKRSVEISEVSDKIEVIHADVKENIPQILTHSCDLVVCNPPYKAIGQGVVNEKKERLIARHEHECTIDDVTKSANKFLNFWGRLCLCHRVERLCDVVESMRKNKIEPKKIQFVYPFKRSKSNMVLIEGAKNGKPGLSVLSNIVVHNEDGSYTKYINNIFNGGD